MSQKVSKMLRKCLSSRNDKSKYKSLNHYQKGVFRSRYINFNKMVNPSFNYIYKGY